MTQRVVITGASRGLGLMTAEHFARQGASLSMLATSKKLVNAEAARLSQRYGCQAEGFVADVADTSAMHAFATSVKSLQGGARVVICNAAVLGPIGRIRNIDMNDADRAFRVNFQGVLNTIQAFWDQLAESGNARVIIVSGGGTGGPRPIPRAPSYVPTKAAVCALTELLAEEFAEIGGAVVAIAPGAIIPTDFLAKARQVGETIAGSHLFDEAQQQLKTPSESPVAGYFALIDHLLTDAGRALNGTLLSGRWNTVEQLKSFENGNLSRNMFKLRRIDGEMFGEL